MSNRRTDRAYFTCDRCGKRREEDSVLNGIRGFETLCSFCWTWEEHQVWQKRREDQLLQQGKVKVRWELIHGVHVRPVNIREGIWHLYRNREDDLYFERFLGSKAELRIRCKEIEDSV